MFVFEFVLHTPAVDEVHANLGVVRDALFQTVVHLHLLLELVPDVVHALGEWRPLLVRHHLFLFVFEVDNFRNHMPVEFIELFVRVHRYFIVELLQMV